MSPKRWIAATATLVTLLAARPGWAIEGTKTHTLSLVHRHNTFRDDTRLKPEFHDLKKEMSFEIASNEEVKIVVEDPNPLLFTYSLDGIERKDTADFQQASQFVDQLKKLEGVLQGTTVQSSSVGPPAEIMALREMVRIQGVEGLDDAGRLKLLQWQSSKAGQIEKILSDNKVDEQFFTKLGGRVATLSDVIARIPGLIERSAGDEGAVERVKDEVDAWDLKELAHLRDDLKKVDDVEFQILQVIGPVSAEPMSQTDSHLFALLITKDQAGAVLDSLGKAEEFVKTVDKIDVPIFLGTIPFSATQNATATISIKVVEANSKVAEKTGRFHDTLKVTFAPLSPVHFGFGGAAVYTFIKKSEFKAETVNGQLKIVEKKSDSYIGQQVAAVLTITPRSWDNPIFGGQFQVGFNPKKDELAFFAGVGFRVFTLARLGVGVTYQQVPKLASGLKAGDPLNTPQDLKVDTEFRGGGYLFISITTK